VVKPSSPVSPPFQAVVPSAAGPRQAGTRSESAPTTVFHADTAADVAEGRRPSAFQQPRLPSPSTARRPAAVIGKKLLILCTRMPLLTLRTCALLHSLDHVHLDLLYFGTKGLSSA
jgi:hypothetical protein